MGFRWGIYGWWFGVSINICLLDLEKVILSLYSREVSFLLLPVTVGNGLDDDVAKYANLQAKCPLPISVVVQLVCHHWTNLTSLRIIVM